MNPADSGVSLAQAASLVNNYFANLIDPDSEASQVDEFKLRGDFNIHGEISFFVLKNDLKQSQISRMAGNYHQTSF